VIGRAEGQKLGENRVSRRRVGWIDVFFLSPQGRRKKEALHDFFKRTS